MGTIQQVLPLSDTELAELEKIRRSPATYDGLDDWAVKMDALLPRLLARLHAAEAAPAAPVTESREGAVLGREVVGRLKREAAGLLSEKAWNELSYHGDVHDGATQGRAMLAKQLLDDLAAAPVVESRPGQIDFLLPIELLRNSAEAMRNQGKPLSACAYQSAADHLALAAAPVATEGAGQPWALVLDGLPEDGADPLYVLGRWEDGDVRRCQVYKGELSCGFPARGGYPVWWMPEPIEPPALKQDGHCTACQYPRYLLKGQHWGSCSNEECTAFKQDMASASYLLPAAPLTPKANSRHAG